MKRNFVKKKKMMVQGGVSYAYQPSHVYTTRPVLFELGFSITIHKAMGKTIDKVILALSDRPSRFSQIHYNGFYVAMSRVKRGDDIRLLIDTGVGIASLNYLKELTMSANIKHYFDGFGKDTLKWNQNLIYESMLKTPKKPSLLHNTKQGKDLSLIHISEPTRR